MKNFNLPSVSADNLTQLEQMLGNSKTCDYAGEAWLALASGKSPSNLLAYAKTCTARAENEYRQTRAIYVSLNEHRGEGDFTLSEQLAAADPCVLATFRETILHDSAESALELVNRGAQVIGRNTMVTGGKILCRRRGEQIRKVNIDRQLQSESFKQGRIGQGSLFRFDGEIDHA